ncbi:MULTISPECIES: ABC transporter substrate-binding protein [Haloferax]|jgi:ABC-type branched-subunit amino acid transport system substrate-binding protein|uniref:ABC transporter substrate-binding protein n=2 Tax=Haloferax TaxID=2251 RepID=A0A558GAB0_HALVO|nr:MULTISPECIES: ABC transporter substrate-binding protein [Haloferax]MBC9987471.1 branched-chain amino acid ABC transporter substrate-binding protein [Haloferax sp. AS1]NLV04403.1 ABC transporter substrate-binding protein [Haloferax alexandrinus]RDZ31798.1 branched-chain amino acid ABC transporter substrate-binding protein [Haloferax sp. Atlit-48N]RDZ34600.1 branched-chain amino acid ABC transporter substrate-binding protein [Haloferax sp. Atlit-24N]RDZ36212.1 branched-chain amino acid ABC tr
MVRDIVRRDFLKGVGAAGAAGLTGLSGCIGGGGGGGGGPEGLVVIGYPESGIQLFRDYYSASDGSEEILVPDGMRSGSMPGQVGNDMANVTGTAPAAGGPNQDTFNQLFEDEYDAAPGVFTSQTYDSVAIQLLANAAAGENSGPAIKDQMRRMANPGGMTVGPDNLVEGVEAAANGEDIDYQGASSSVNFDENGDPAEAAYAIWTFDADNNATSQEDVQSFEGDSPDGSGPAADSGPGGSDREMSIGILLPETGDLAAVGAPMIQAGQIPVMQVNDANPAGLSVNAQIEDTQTSPDAGVSAAQSLVSAGVPSVCGSASSGVNVPVSQQAFIPNEIVGCSPSSTALSVSNLDDNDFIFRTAPSDFLQGRVMAQVMAERLEASSVSTLYVNNDYGQQLSERFASVFSDSFDGEVYNQVAFNIGESSYSSVIETALSGPDS